MGYVVGDTLSVLVLGVALADGMETLWVAPLEVLGGQCCATSGVAV